MAIRLAFWCLSSDIPRLDSIHEYRATFDDVDDTIGEPAHFVLVLFDSSHLPPALKSYRSYVPSDELGDVSPKASEVRQSIHIITTWNWNFDTKIAEFWLRSDTMESLQFTKQ